MEKICYGSVSIGSRDRMSRAVARKMRRVRQEEHVMILGIGVLLFFGGGLLALLGYAPLLSSDATSLAMILAGGFAVTAGTFLVLFASARSSDKSDLEDIELIRP
jgi:hypothetical protein